MARELFISWNFFFGHYRNARNVPTWAIISRFILIYNSNCFISLMMRIVVWQAFVLMQWLLIFGKIIPLCLLVLLCNGVAFAVQRRNKMESFHKSCLLKAEAGICYLNDAVPTTPKKSVSITCNCWLIFFKEVVCFWHIRKITKRNCYRPLFCPYAWNSSTPTGRIVTNLDIRLFFENLPRGLQFG
jgi:hypothetical protein